MEATTWGVARVSDGTDRARVVATPARDERTAFRLLERTHDRAVAAATRPGGWVAVVRQDSSRLEGAEVPFNFSGRSAVTFGTGGPDVAEALRHRDSVTRYALAVTSRPFALHNDTPAVYWKELSPGTDRDHAQRLLEEVRSSGCVHVPGDCNDLPVARVELWRFHFEPVRIRDVERVQRGMSV